MNKLLSLIALLSLLTLAACGGKQAGTTLMVTSGMALSNSSYQGGLVFFGRSTTGKSFSAPVGYSGSSLSNKVEVLLDHGNWTFGAVGWESDPDVFEGNAKCALLSGVVLDSSDKTVNLTLSTANCNDAAFGGNYSGSAFEGFEITTCGTYYKDTTTLASQLTNYDPDYCKTNTISADMKNHAKSARISIPVSIPGQTPTTSSPLSVCLALTDGDNQATLKNLPRSGLPIRAELFEGPGCIPSELLTSYTFDRGMGESYSQFDHQIHSNLTKTHLFLLTSISRRGTSPLMAAIPSFRCHNSNPAVPCIAFPTTSAARYIAPFKFFYLKDKVGNDSCSNLITPITIGSSPYTFTSDDCYEKDNKFFARVTYDVSLAPYNCTTCTIVFPFASANLSLSVEVQASPNTRSLDAYDLIFRTVGHYDISQGLAGGALNAYMSLNIFNSYNNHGDDKTFGALRNVRQIFGPDVGGFYLGLNDVTMINKSFNVALWDEGIFKSYQVKMEADNTLVPDSMAHDTDLAFTPNTTKYFTHKITISEIKGGAFYPQEVTRFVFNGVNFEQVGMSESLHNEIYSNIDESRTERELTYWNTNSPDYGRFEKYSFDKTVKHSNSSIVLNQRTSFTRAERNPTTNNAIIQEYAFESKKQAGLSTDYDERGYKNLLVLNGNRAIYSHSWAEHLATTPLNYFTQDIFFPYNRSATVSASTAYAKSPNGQHTVLAWAEFTGSLWNLKIARKSSGGASVISSIAVGSTTSFIPKVSINNGGQASVAWIKYDTGTNFAYAITWWGNNWEEATNNTSTVSANVITLGGGALASTTLPMLIDIVDVDPASANSDKAIVYYKYDSVNFEHKFYYSVFNNGTGIWSNTTEFADDTVVEGEPTHLNLVNTGGTNYNVAWVFNSGTDYVLKVLSTNNFATPDVDNTVLTSIQTPAGLYSQLLGSNLKTVILDSDPSNNMQATFASNTLSAPSAISFATHRLGLNVTPYCFERSTSTPGILGAAPETTGCTIPDASYVSPIKSGYKYDIESLKPTTFNSIFTLN